MFMTATRGCISVDKAVGQPGCVCRSGQQGDELSGANSGSSDSGASRKLTKFEKHENSSNNDLPSFTTDKPPKASISLGCETCCVYYENILIVSLTIPSGSSTPNMKAIEHYGRLTLPTCAVHPTDEQHSTQNHILSGHGHFRSFSNLFPQWLSESKCCPEQAQVLCQESSHFVLLSFSSGYEELCVKFAERHAISITRTPSVLSLQRRNIQN